MTSTILQRAGGPVALARKLLWITLAWNVIEGIIAVGSGVAAGSVALVGFGLDSSIEVAAAGIVLWRMQLPEHDERAEQRELLARRVVGATFLLLAVYIFAQALYVPLTGNHPDSSTVGITLAAAAAIAMPFLGVTKRWNAERIGSRALMAESTETIFCSYLSFTLFIGLVANALFGWWWADIVAALAMVPWIVKEGLEGVRGEHCEDNC